MSNVSRISSHDPRRLCWSHPSCILRSLPQIQELRALASLGVAVLCLNQVTTKSVPASMPAMASYANFGQPIPPTLASGPSDAAQPLLTLAPALGRAWASVPQVRLLLHWHGDHRAAALCKAPWSRRETAVSHALFAVDER